jgi:hypothetical protein
MVGVVEGFFFNVILGLSSSALFLEVDFFLNLNPFISCLDIVENIIL